jgi:hypothetical protein
MDPKWNTAYDIDSKRHDKLVLNEKAGFRPAFAPPLGLEPRTP